MQSNKILEQYSEEQMTEIRRIIKENRSFRGWGGDKDYMSSYPKEVFQDVFFSNEKSEMVRFFNMILDQFGKRRYRCIKTYPGCRFSVGEEFTTQDGGTGYGGDIDNDGWWIKNETLDKEKEYYERIS